ncbi:MAG: HAMP domain-containing histidine kinase [Elusimicrobia bacterium]|nr:HAMP domain-containing histidine kinase [Elusimicrobiota bacterium]
MSAASRAGETAFRHQEIAFSVCMAAVAVLLRDNPDYSRHFLWAFTGLLAFNLAYHVVLRRRGETWYVPMVSMAVNTLLVTLLVYLSGGANSPFWPMYLIPIFTACLYLSIRHVVFATAASAAFLASLYLYLDAQAEPLQWTFAELVIKLAVLAVSASVTAQNAFRERHARVELAAARSELGRLAAELERAESERLESAGGMNRFMAGLVYDLNARMTLILGRAELLTETLGEDSQQAEDARGIAEAARALSRLGSDMLRVLKRGDEEVRACDVTPAIKQVLTLIEFRLRPRRLRLDSDLAEDLPAVPVATPHLQQALLELLEIAVERADPESLLLVSAAKEADEVRIRLRFDGGEDAAPPSPVAQRRLLEPFGGTVEALGLGRSCEFVILLPLGSATRGPR